VIELQLNCSARALDIKILTLLLLLLLLVLCWLQWTQDALCAPLLRCLAKLLKIPTQELMIKVRGPAHCI
jgi:hypothetical protein